MSLRDPKHAQAEALLERLRLEQRAIVVQSVIALIVGSLAAIWLASGFIEAVFQFTQTWRMALFSLAVALSVFSAFLLFRRVSDDISLHPGIDSQTFWALKLGSLTSHKQQDRLLNALQVIHPTHPGKDNPSPELARESLYRAVAELEVVNYSEVLSRSERVVSIRIGSTLLLAFILSIAIRPTIMLGAFGRLVHPATDYAPASPFSLTVSPTGGWAYRSEPISFQIEASGQPPRTGSFIYQQDGGEEVSLDLDLRSGSATVGFAGFPSDVTYVVNSGEVSTERYKLQIIPRPQIVELNYRLHPPAYTRLPIVAGRENVGDVECLPGSSVDLRVTSSKKLSSAVMITTKAAGTSITTDTMAMNIDDKQASIDFIVRNPSTYTVRLRDRDNHEDKDPVTYRIHTLTDEYPVARITFPEEDVVLGEDMHVPLRIEADDDFSISRLELNYHNLNGDTLVQKWNLGLTKTARNIILDTLWSIGNMPLMPGDVLEYWVVVWDNDNVSGPKRSESTRRLVRLPTFEEIVAGVEQTETEVEIDAQKTLEAAKELKEEVARLVEEMRRDPNANWERQKQIDQAMKDQEQISKQAEQMSKTLDDLVNKLEKHDMLTPETLEKYMELQKLMNEVASPELKQAMEKLKQAMESQDPEKIRQALEQFDMDREEFMKSIERSLAILQQLKLERKLDELVKRAEELLHAQEQILKDIEENRTEEASKSLDVQKIGVESLKKEMAETAKMASEAEKSQLSDQLDSLGAKMDNMNLPQQMAQTSQSVQAGNKSKAKSTGEESARSLAEMAASLKNLSQEFKDKNKADLALKIRRLVEELIYVSEDQENLMSECRALGTESPRYRELAGEQQDVKQALEGIAGRMLDLSKETFFVTPELGASIGKALQQIDKSLEGFSDRLPRSAAQPQKQTLGEINKSAAQLLAILGELSGSSSSSGYEEMMKKLSEMASQQQGLNQQSMPMPGGSAPGQMPGEGQSLAQMAAQQRALQQSMEQAAQDAEGIKEMLGDLQGTADAMGEVAKDMENDQIGERTRRLQQQIVSRLLDATRSAREEEYSKKRESKSGQELRRFSPSQTQLNSERDRLRRDLLKALQEGYTPDYRKLIREYYDALGEEVIKK